MNVALVLVLVLVCNCDTAQAKVRYTFKTAFFSAVRPMD